LDLWRGALGSSEPGKRPVDVSPNRRARLAPGGSQDASGELPVAALTRPLNNADGEGREDRGREPRADGLDRAGAVGSDPIPPLDAAIGRSLSGLIEESRELHE
jgi:hypothetical protein